MDWAEFESAVRALRDAGVVTVLSATRVQGTPARTAADSLAVAAHYTPIGDLWTPLSREQAAGVLHHILARDLAYHIEVMNPKDVARLSAAFLDHVGNEAEFFTNLDSPVAGEASWEPLSQATFDTGVVGVGMTRAAMLWVEDED